MPFKDAIYDEESLVRDLRALLKKRKRSARSISKDIGLPYRSMQNYLSGESRIPAIVLVNILHYLGSDIQELRFGNRLLIHHDMRDAIFRVFGDFLAEIDPNRLGSRESFSSHPDWQAKHNRAQFMASTLAARLSEAYDEFARQHIFPGPMPTIKDIRDREARRLHSINPASADTESPESSDERDAN